MSTGPSPLRSKILLLAFVAIVAAALGIWSARGLIGGAQRPPDLGGATLYPAPKPLAAFTLTDHRGQLFDLDRLRGKWSFVFFGYTHCPDVCPTALSVLNVVDRRLAQNSRLHAGTQVIFVSVDPARDTPERLAQFVPYFNPAFIGVTGSADQIDTLTRSVGVLYARSGDQDSQAGYLVDHSASILLVDPQARLYAIFSPPHDPAVIATDFEHLRTYYEDQR